MSVDASRDPRLLREAQESPLSQSLSRILSVSNSENQAAADSGNGSTELTVKANALIDPCTLPPSGISAKPPALPLPFVRQSKAFRPQFQATSDEAALKDAVFIGDTDEVCRILSLPNTPNVNVPLEPRLLMLAARQGFADIAGMLLRAGAEVDAKAFQTETTALMAAAAVGHTMTTMVLLQWGADPDAINAKSETALLLAIRGEHTAVVGQLLAYGANPLPSAVAPRTKRSLLPLQLARHLGNAAIQEALIAANRMMDHYLTNLVRGSLPPDTRLIDPGHPTTQQSITPRSLSFIPVQIVSNVKSTTLLQLTFNTPPCYSDHFSSISQGSVMDELILLYVVCVDLQDGQVIAPRCSQSMPVYNLVYFNGSHTPAVCLNPVRNFRTIDTSSSSSPIDVDELPGFRVFVLGNRLNKGGLNSITMYQRWDHETQVFGPFQKLLIGIYRVRVELSAFSKETSTDMHGEMATPVAIDTNNDKIGDNADGDDNDDDSDGDDNTLC
ncbi:Ankyrin-3 [Echinococcus granulosus]|uniref:Ankyrin repeat domain containing protein n=1 Tax=Echinococcus granulosus TaxID=6210 RepID=A0A068WN52_ECHGR|nr:Ankyrin-3 [Echinococcus granulosus]CDS19888.1 Ankyrin repeat domain containing protein [Echinococcus granulosus]